MDLIEDLCASYENPPEAWPEWSLLPVKEPKDERMRKIYEKLRESIILWGKTMRSFVEKGYEFRSLRFEFEEDNKAVMYEYPRPYESWTYGRDGDVVLVLR